MREEYADAHAVEVRIHVVEHLLVCDRSELSLLPAVAGVIATAAMSSAAAEPDRTAIMVSSVARAQFGGLFGDFDE
jgi:hypothetical protein